MTLLNPDAEKLVEKYKNAHWLYNELDAVYKSYTILYVLKRKDSERILITPAHNLRKNWRENFIILEKVKSEFSNPYY